MKFLIFSLILFPMMAIAQDRVGNGGDVIACLEKDSLNKVLLLDFYESSDELATLSGTYEEIVQNRLNALKKMDVTLGQQYAQRWQSMKSEIEFKDNVQLVDIKDSSHTFEPEDKNCQLKQIAIRRKLVFGKQGRFVVNKKYWNHLSATHQAGLIWHEMIYEHLAKLGEKDSIKARAMNAEIFSSDFEKKSAADFWKFIQTLKVPIYRKN